MESTSTSRHELVFSASSFNPRHVGVVGVGAVGSYLMLFLAKLGVRNISIYDHDVVSIENVGTSLYGKKHVGMKKVEACEEIIRDLSDDIRVTPVFGRIEDVPDLTGTIFLCVDSMDLRKELVCGVCVPRAQFIPRVFEGRMSATFLMAHSFDPGRAGHIQEWLQFWFPDSAALPALQGCGATRVSVGPTASTVASILATQFIQWWAQQGKSGPPLVSQVRFDLSTFEGEAHTW